jgi:hypothetical protein
MKMPKTAVVLCGLFAAQFCPGQTSDPPAPSVVLPAGLSETLYVPMTQAERLQYFLKGTFSVSSLVKSGLGAAIAQGRDSPHEWGQGAMGYARRYGNSHAQHIVLQTVTYGTSSMLGEDNRYFVSGKQSFRSRAFYAVGSTFLARRSDGTRRISYSRISGIAASALISRAWHPPSTNGMRDALNNGVSTAATQAGFNVGREFFPKVFNRLK